MSAPPTPPVYRRDEWGAVNFAVFLILLGAFWLAYPTLWSEIGRFFSDLILLRVGGVPVFVEPASNHPLLYGVIAQFFAILSLWLFSLAAVRWYQHSHPRLVSRTLTRGVFLLGLAFFSLQLQADVIPFSSIVPLIVILAGASLIIRGLWNIYFTKGSP